MSTYTVIDTSSQERGSQKSVDRIFEGGRRLLVLLLPLLLASCVHTGSEKSRQIGPLHIRSSIDGVLQAKDAQEPPYSLHSMAYSLYGEILQRLEIAELMSQEERSDFVAYIAKVSLLHSENRDLQTRIRVRNYFERGDLIIRIQYRDGERPSIEWRSNAYADPLSGRPLRGRGGFSPPSPLLENIAGKLYYYPPHLIGETDLYSLEREEALRRRGELLLLAHGYILDQFPAHTERGRMICDLILTARSQPKRRRIAALCTRARAHMREAAPEASQLAYERAAADIAEAKRLCSGCPVYLKDLVERVEEEYLLSEELRRRYLKPGT